MVLKSVTHRSELAATAASAAAEWAAPATEKLEELLVPYLQPGEAMPDVALLQVLLGRLLVDRGEALLGKGQEQERSEREARTLRWRRNEAAEALREALRGARYYLDGAHGRGAGARAGLGHGLSRMPPMFLVRLGAEIADILEEAPPARANIALALPDPRELAGLVRQRAVELGALVEAIHPQRQGCTHARGEKLRSLAATEAIVRRGAGFLAELYRLCDLPFLAEKVRPAFRRRSRPEKEEAAAAGPAPAAPPFASPAPLAEKEKAAAPPEAVATTELDTITRCPDRSPLLWGLGLRRRRGSSGSRNRSAERPRRAAGSATARVASCNDP